MNIPSVGAELFHVDRRTDGQTVMTKLKVVFRSFANAHNDGKAISVQAWTGPEGARRLRFPDFKTVGI